MLRIEELFIENMPLAYIGLFQVDVTSENWRGLK